MNTDRFGAIDGTDQPGEIACADPGALLPLSPAMYHILLALAGGERHGYAIMREVAERAGGQVRLGTGTLYRSIQQLLAAGLIEEAGERPDRALDDERRCSSQLRASADRWRRQRLRASRDWRP